MLLISLSNFSIFKWVQMCWASWQSLCSREEVAMYSIFVLIITVIKTVTESPKNKKAKIFSYGCFNPSV